MDSLEAGMQVSTGCLPRELHEPETGPGVQEELSGVFMLEKGCFAEPRRAGGPT